MLMKTIVISLLAIALVQTATAQKTVDAVVKFTGADTSLTIKKSKSFVVELSEQNRKGFEWIVDKPAANCKFLSSQIGEAATMPGAPQLMLYFFKATQKGEDSIRFVYKKMPADTSSKHTEKLLRVTVE